MPELVPSDVVEVLDANVATEKRASWEGFEFTLLGDGDVEIVNSSYENPEDHSYRVHVEAGIPSDCSCPAFEYQDGPCKHLVAVAIREPVLGAATEDAQVRADGGAITESSTDDSPEEECRCKEYEFPCFECFHLGRRELPE